MMVPTISAPNMSDEHTNTGRRYFLRESFLYAHSTNNGNENATPARGRYIRRSNMTSTIGTTLEVGDNEIKNQKIENANTGCRRRHHHPMTMRLERNTIEARTAG